MAHYSRIYFRKSRRALPAIALSTLANFAVLPNTGHGQSVASWKVYTDAHGSSVQVPSALVRVQSDPSALAFRSADGNTFATFETITEERPGFPGNDPEGDLRPTSKDCDALPPSYRVINSRVSAYSCDKAGKIEYWIARYSRSGSIRLHLEYSRSDKNYWDPIVTRMSASMKQQERHEMNR
jgi:hypothetical protein